MAKEMAALAALNSMDSALNCSRSAYADLLSKFWWVRMIVPTIRESTIGKATFFTGENGSPHNLQRC